MEITLRKVHTNKDIIISSSVIIAGFCLFFLNKGLGIFIALIGIFMLLMYKDGYKNETNDILLKKKSLDISRYCRQSVVNFLDGRNNSLEFFEGNSGGTIRLDVFYNQEASIAYAQLFDFNNLSFEQATELKEFQGLDAEILMSYVDK